MKNASVSRMVQLFAAGVLCIGLLMALSVPPLAESASVAGDIREEGDVGPQNKPSLSFLSLLLDESSPPVLETFTNSIGQTFKLIPAGTFRMGSPEDEPGRWVVETQHQVTLTKDFYIMTTEVTQGQWKTVMESNPSWFSSCGDDCPVENISWDDVQVFISALNTREGVAQYRLPTEAEWEFAARAGSTTAFANGNIVSNCDPIDPNLNQMGWFCCNSGSTTHPVAQKQANAWGLYDMHGNVPELCQDWMGDYPVGAVIDPQGPSSGVVKVLRGGYFLNDSVWCRSASRFFAPPNLRDFDIGFRLAMTP